MNAARRMKLEMTLKQRAGGCRRTTLEDLAPTDRVEVERFSEFLQHANEPLAALVERFGANYLGFGDEATREVHRHEGD